MTSLLSASIDLNILSSQSERPWLNNLVKPWWIKNDLHDDVWHLYEGRGDKIGKTIPLYWRERLYDGITGEITFLTDPVNSKLLETAQLFSYYVRESDITQSISTETHKNKSLTIKTIIAWMLLNGINQFSDLNRYDFKTFCCHATGGTTGLLDAYRRLDRLYRQLKEKNSKFPLHDKPFPHDPDGINNDKLSKLLGYDTCKVHNDKLWQYMLVNYSSDLGHRIKRTSRKYLECDEPEAGSRSVSGFRSFLVIWNDLFVLRNHFTDMLTFDPLKHDTASDLAVSVFKEMDISIEEGRTETIPATQLAFLVDRALRWVLLYADELLDLRDEFEHIIKTLKSKKSRNNLHKLNETARERFGKFLENYTPNSFIPNNPDYPSAPWPLAPTKNNVFSESHVAGFGRVVNKFIPIACAIVIATFTARRHDEILSVRDSNLTEYDNAPPAIEIDEEGTWLWCYIEKTVQDWDRVPCPTSTVKAIEVLTRWSKDARELTGDRRLFTIKAIGSEEVYGLQFGRYLNDFAEFIGVPLCDDELKWFFKPHQFRRFFSIVYMHRYEHANLTALSHQLRHETTAMTETYATELRDGDLVSAAKKEHALEVITEVALGKRTATGPAGEKLDEMLASHFKRALKDVEILPERLNARKAKQIAERIMNKLNMNLIPFKYGYCMAFTKLKFTNASCVSGQESTDAPDLTKATVSKCTHCSHFYTDQTFKPYWESMAEIYTLCLQHEKLPDVHRKRAQEMYDLFVTGLQGFDRSDAEGVNA